MTDTPKPAEPGAEPNTGASDPKNDQSGGKPAGDDTLTLVRHGQEHKVPLSKAVELAQKGLDYEKKMAEIKSQRELLESEKAAYEEYKRFQEYLRSNPTVQEAVKRALADPDSVLNTSRDDLDDDTDGMSASALEELRREIREAKMKLGEFEAKERASEISDNIRSEISGYPWLTGKRADLAFRQVFAVLRESPETPVAAAVLQVAQEIRDAMTAEQKDALDNSNKNRNYKSEPPGSGLPHITPPPSYKKGEGRKELMDGTISERILKSLGLK